MVLANYRRKSLATVKIIKLNSRTNYPLYAYVINNHSTKTESLSIGVTKLALTIAVVGKRTVTVL